MKTPRLKIRPICFTAIMVSAVWILHSSAPVPATCTYDSKFLTVAVINPIESPQTPSLKIRNAELFGKGTLQRITPERLTATVVFGQEPGVKIEEQTLNTMPKSPTFAPFSVNIYEFQVK
jgi:hypothetical protein